MIIPEPVISTRKELSRVMPAPELWLIVNSFAEHKVTVDTGRKLNISYNASEMPKLR